MQFACSIGDAQMVEQVLKKGADPNPSPNVGYGFILISALRLLKTIVAPSFPPLHIACRFGFTDIVRILIKHGARIFHDNVHKSKFYKESNSVEVWLYAFALRCRQ